MIIQLDKLLISRRLLFLSLSLALTSDTSLWQLSTDLVSSCSCVRISHKATVVSRCRSPRCSSSSFADRFMLITLTCFCKLQTSSMGRAMLQRGTVGGCAVNMRAMHTIQSRKTTMTKTKTKTLRDVTCRHRVTQSGPRTIVVAVEAVVQAVVVVAFSCIRVGLRISHTSLCFVTVKGEISSKNAL